MARKFVSGKPTVGTTPVVIETRTISTTAPVTGGGDLSADRTIAVSAASTSAAGVVQLSDSTSTTGSTKAATETAVKSAYDLAAAAVPKSTVTTQGDLIVATGSAAVTRLAAGASGAALVSGGAGTTPSYSTTINGTAIPSSKTLVVTTDADSANTASKIVQRDASGNFSAGTITASLTGTASGNIASTLADAKGEIPVGTASGPSSLALGTDGHVLTADSTLTTGVKWSAPAGSSTLNGPVVVGSTQSSTTLGNNFALNSTTTLLRYTGTADATLTGVAAAGPATPADGRMLYIFNATTFTVTLSHASASSTAAYRMNLPGATAVTLAAHEGVNLIYDGTSTAWRAAYPFNIAGNAATATTLQTARLINGTSFNGSADITVTAAAGTLTGATLASGVTASSLTSFGSNATLTTPVITQATSTPTFTTNTYTLVIGDAGDLLLASNSTTAGNVKIPTNATVAFPVGTQVHIIQTGTGQLTISATTSGTTTVV